MRTGFANWKVNGMRVPVCRMGTMRNVLSRITGNFNNGQACPANFDIQSGTNILISDVTINANGPCNGGAIPADKAVIRVMAGVGKFLDTWYIDKFRSQCWDGVTAAGEPIGILVDHTNGRATNGWVTDSYVDHATVCQTEFRASGSTSGAYLRVIHETGNRLTADSGAVVCFDSNNGQFVDGVQINNNRMNENTGSPFVKILQAHGGGSTAYQGVQINDNTFNDLGPSAPTPIGVDIGVEGFMFCGNLFEGRAAAPSGVQYAYKIEDPAIADLKICNSKANEAAHYISEPLPYTAPNDPARQIDFPRPQGAPIHFADDAGHTLTALSSTHDVYFDGPWTAPRQINLGCVDTRAGEPITLHIGATGFNAIIKTFTDCPGGGGVTLVTAAPGTTYAAITGNTGNWGPA